MDSGFERADGEDPKKIIQKIIKQNSIYQSILRSQIVENRNDIAEKTTSHCFETYIGNIQVTSFKN